jgi:hypothetical protein
VAQRIKKLCALARLHTTKIAHVAMASISGGISPDLRKIDNDCADLADQAKKNACYQEISEYFVATVRRGRTRDGRVYMPPFEGTLSQEAIWSIKTYLETRRER